MGQSEMKCLTQEYNASENGMHNLATENAENDFQMQQSKNMMIDQQLNEMDNGQID